MNAQGSTTVVICPVYTSEQIHRRIKTGTFRLDRNGELEKRCSSCREYLPADTEFFHGNRQSGRLDLHTWCKFCVAERRPNRNPSHGTRGVAA